MKRRQAGLVCWVCFAAALMGCQGPGGAAAPGPGGATPGPALVAVGNHNNLFVAQAVSVGGAEGFSYSMRDARGAWHAPATGRGRIAAAAAWREHLLVFFPTGRYGLFGLDRPDVQPAPAPSWVPCAVCEDGLAVDAFGWDADSGPLYARFEAGTWTHQRLDVALERDRVLDPVAVRFAGRVYLLWREEVPRLRADAPAFRLRFLYGRAGRWTAAPPSRIHVASAVSVAATPDRMVCLYRRPRTDGGAGPGEAGLRPTGAGPWTLAAYETTDEDFHEVGDLRPTQGEVEQPQGPLPDAPPILARQGGRFCLVTVSDGRPEVADLDVAMARVGPPAPVPDEGGPGRPGGMGFHDLYLVAAVAVGFALLLALHARAVRQRGAAAGRPLPAGLVPAPLWRRGAALVLDNLILTAVMVPIVLGFFPAFVGRFWRGEPQPWQEVAALEGIQVALTTVYFTVAEAVWGRTAGKAALGLVVRHESGRAPTWVQAAVRNVLRVLDELPMLYLVGLVSIIVGPWPQRLGDRASGTLVVMHPTQDARPRDGTGG